MWLSLLQRLPVLLILSVLVALFIFLNFGLNLISTRFDVTEDRRYSLSEGTRDVLSSLSEPVIFRYYLSESDNTLPLELRSYANYVRDVLEQFSKASNGLLAVELMDPLPDTEAEVSAQLDGIRGHPVGEDADAYMGLCISALKKNDVIPFLNPERENDLEYDLVSRIQRVTQGKKPKAAIYSNLTTFGKGRVPPWALVELLDQHYEITHIKNDRDALPENLELLIVIHPQDPALVFDQAVEKYLRQGGRAIIMMDTVTVSKMAYNEKLTEGNASSSWDSLLGALKLSFTSKEAVLDMNFKHRLNRGNGPEVLNCVLMLDERGVNPNHSITEGLQQIILPIAGAFFGEGLSSMEQTVLLRSSPDSQLYDNKDLIDLSEITGKRLLNQFKADADVYPLAILLEGVVPSFTGQDPLENPEPAKILLLSDADMASDPFAGSMVENQKRVEFKPASANLPFIFNVIDHLAGDTNLNQIRGRSQTQRPLTRLIELRRKAEERYLAKINELEEEQEHLMKSISPGQLSSGIIASQGSLDQLSQNYIQQLKQRRVQVNQDLRQLRRDFRSSIQRIESTIKWLNIVGLPVLIAIAGVVVTSIRHFKGRARV